MESKPEDEMPPLSEEDSALWKAATREYNTLKLQQHRAWQAELSIKLQLKKAALAALPGMLGSCDCLPACHAADSPAAMCAQEHLRGAAEATQTELVPLNRQMFTLTPPIPGFREQAQTASGGRRRGQRGR